MSEWIKCSDRLPNENEEVFFFVQTERWDIDRNTGRKIGDPCIHREIVIGHIVDGDLWVNYDQDNIYSTEDITHWQYRMAFPKY